MMASRRVYSTIVAIASLLLILTNHDCNVNGQGTMVDNADADGGLVDQIEEFLSSDETRDDRLEMAQRVLSNRASTRRRTRKNRKLMQDGAQETDRGTDTTRTQQQSEGGHKRELSMDEDHWKTMKLVVEADTQALRRVQLLLRRVPQDTYLGADASNFAQGDLLVGGRCQNPDGAVCGNFDNNNMYRRNNPNVPVGISFQTCITPTQTAQSINKWLCTWVLSFSDMMMNQVMAQGNYFRATTSQLFAWAPQYQFLSITGGTGIFRGVTGFIIISPRDFGMRPGSTNIADLGPEFWYYLVYKLV